MWPLRGIRGAEPGGEKPSAPDRFDPVGRKIHTFQSGDYSLEYITCGAAHLRPLVILHSIEYPGWPPVEFCRAAEAAGFRIVAVRRPGFGGNPTLPDADAQHRLITEFLASGGLEGAVVASSGTAGPVAGWNAPLW